MCSTDKRSWQPTQTGGGSPQSKCRCVKYACPIRRRQRISSSLRRFWDEWGHNPNSGCTIWSLLWTCWSQKNCQFFRRCNFTYALSNSSLTVLILKYKCLISIYSTQWIRMCSTDKRSWQPTQTGGGSPQSKCRCVKYACPIRRRQRISSSLRRSWDEWGHNPNSGCTIWSLLWTCWSQKNCQFFRRCNFTYALPQECTTVSFDGSWQKRGHTSLYGLATVIDVLTGLVLDYEILSKYCHVCAIKKAENLVNHQLSRQMF